MTDKIDFGFHVIAPLFMDHFAGSGNMILSNNNTYWTTETTFCAEKQIHLVFSPLPQLFHVEMMRCSHYSLFINQPASIFVLCVEGEQAIVCRMLSPAF